jgi:cytidine deaminase
MTVRSNDDLIDAAAAVLHPHHVDGRTFGDVASALITDAGNLYVGVCIDTSCGTGFCAEHAAIAAMVTAREYKIAKIVAVWQGTDAIHAVPPCGRCREFIRQIDPSNLNTEVVLSPSRTSTLRDLLPANDWPA